MPTDIFQDTDPSKDLPAVRVVEVPDGSPFLVERVQPHGFWAIRREHGQVPEQLKGLYTAIEIAQTAIQVYLNSRPRMPKVKKNDNQSA